MNMIIKLITVITEVKQKSGVEIKEEEEEEKREIPSLPE